MSEAAARRRALWPALLVTVAALLAATVAQASLPRDAARSELLAKPALAEALANADRLEKARFHTLDPADEAQETLAGSLGGTHRPTFTVDLAKALQNSPGADKARVHTRSFALFDRPPRPAANASAQNLASTLEDVGPEKLASGVLTWEPRLNVWRIRHFASILQWAPEKYAFVAWQPQMYRDPMGECGNDVHSCSEVIKDTLDFFADEIRKTSFRNTALTVTKLAAATNWFLLASSHGAVGDREALPQEYLANRVGYSLGKTADQIRQVVEAVGPPPMPFGPIAPNPATALSTGGVMPLPARPMPLSMPMPVVLPGGGTHYATSEPVASESGEESSETKAEPAWKSYEKRNGGVQTPMTTTFRGQSIQVRLDKPPEGSLIVDFKAYDWSKKSYSKPFIRQQVITDFTEQIKKYLTIRPNVHFQFSQQPPEWAVQAVEGAGGTFSVVP